MELDDRRLMEELLGASCEQVAYVLTDLWHTSEQATLATLRRILALFAVKHLEGHPEHRAAEIAALQQLSAYVEVETGATKH